MLNVRHIAPCSVETNGPGARVVVWLQGCVLRCTTRCQNAAALSMEPARLVAPVALVALIMRYAVSLRRRRIEGVSFSGGEPMDQAEDLLEVCRLLRAQSALSIMVFTGYTLGYLRARGTPAQQALLGEIDILKHGPFRPDLEASLMWRGSTNQRVEFLTSRYAPESVGLRDGMRRSEWIIRGSAVEWTGFPGDESAVIDSLRRYGIEIKGWSK
jgi:anaerobic ribonucleoside-triphosphate reductase activating protein